MQLAKMYQKISRKNQPWGIFSIKAISVSVLTAGVILYCASRFTIGFDTQETTSIVGHRVYLIDKHNKTLEKDALYAFYPKSSIAFGFLEGTRLIKYLRGLPGEEVRIQNNRVYIDDKLIATGLETGAKMLSRDIQFFEGHGIIKPDTYWFLGTSLDSFDSRYWGAVSKNEISGRAYVIY